jgi:hypothetical protein
MVPPVGVALQAAVEHANNSLMHSVCLSRKTLRARPFKQRQSPLF